MFEKITVSLSPERQYTAYVAGDHVEIEARIDGHSARFGTATWDGTTLRCEAVPLRTDALTALTRALRLRAAS